MRRGRFIIVGLLSLIVLTTDAQNSPSFISDSLDRYITEGLKDWNIPGLAIAVIKDGKTVVMKGYGVKDVETKEPVNENTLFMIASNTKLFTATALAQLEYNKRLSIDDKISRYIKGYALYDKNTTDMVTIRDLLSHRIGTKTFQGDFVFWNSNLSRSQVMYKMRLLKPTHVFRKEFGYCNSCVVTAGEAIPVVSRMPWEVYIYDSLLMPLQMNNTHTLGQGITQRANVAKPYTTFYTGQLTQVPYDNVDNMGAAASIVSNVKDMSHWLQMQLDSGKYNGKRILPWSVLQRTREKNITVKYGSSTEWYGLGIDIADLMGHQVFYHTGGTCGFVSNTCFVPDAKLGIVILSNNDNQSFFEALRQQVLQAYFGIPYDNESKRALKVFSGEQAKAVAVTNALRARLKGKKPPISINAYEGTYVNELYGDIDIIRNAEDKLQANFKGNNNLQAIIEYMDNDEWLLTYNNLTYGIFPINFKTENNHVISVQVRVNDYIDYDPYVFTKK